MDNALTVAVTGGGGYAGSVLVPALLELGYKVRVIDLMWYGSEALQSVANHPSFELIVGDIRDQSALRKTFESADVVIHLACVSNDPCSDLDPALTKSINLDAYRLILATACDAGVKRFINASSSSVYGVKQELNVTEVLPLEPITLYARYKAETEAIVSEFQSPEFTTVSIRSATLCGFSPSQRLDLTVNILTNFGYNNHKIIVHGGQQRRPNIHIRDTIALYCQLVEAPAELIAGEAFNVGFENHTVMEIAELVRDVLAAEIGERVDIEVTDSYDERSYHISSSKIRERLGFEPQYTIADAVRDLVKAFAAGRLPDSMTDTRYFRVKRMQELIAQEGIRA